MTSGNAGDSTLGVDDDLPAADDGVQQGARAFRMLSSIRRGRWSVMVSGALLLLIVVICVFGPLLYRHDPFAIAGNPLVPPFTNGAQPLGTDVVGHSILVDLIYGGRPMLLVGLISASVIITIGVTIGGLAGYFGGWIDAVLSRVIEMAMTIPTLLVAIVVLSLVRPTNWNLALVIGIISWTDTARVARGEFLRFRESEFVRSARVGGSSNLRIMRREVLPNAVPPLIAMCGLSASVAMLAQAGISFLGLSDANQMSWGLMMGGANLNAMLQAWWPEALPGLAIFITVGCVNILASGVNAALDPRRKGKTNEGAGGSRGRRRRATPSAAA